MNIREDNGVVLAPYLLACFPVMHLGRGGRVWDVTESFCTDCRRQSQPENNNLSSSRSPRQMGPECAGTPRVGHQDPSLIAGRADTYFTIGAL